MIKTKYIVADITDVPSVWVMEHYLKVPWRLEGQDIMIKSVFNSNDKIPSLSIYVDKKGLRPQYRFKDHSTGYGGDKMDLVGRLFNLEPVMASRKIMEDYNEYVLNNGDDNVKEFKECNKYGVKEWKRRKWNVLDRKYWTQYEIGSKDCERYQVWPLEYYRLSNEEKELIITGEQIYGYFTNLGEIYEIYQPMVRDRRFMKVKNHTKGLDQLTGRSDTCLILESLKDVICVYCMDIYESVGADSATTLLPERVINELKSRYKYLIPVLNNDAAGIQGMKKYEEKYGLPGVMLPLEKDPSDSVKKYGGEKVAKILGELIYNKLTEVLT